MSALSQDLRGRPSNRLSWFTGIAICVLVSGGCDIYNPKALRASMGSLLRLYVEETADLPAMLAEANEAGMLTLAPVPSRDAEDIRDVDKSGGVVCCVGNEGSGPSD